MPYREASRIQLHDKMGTFLKNIEVPWKPYIVPRDGTPKESAARRRRSICLEMRISVSCMEDGDGGVRRAGSSCPYHRRDPMKLNCTRKTAS